MRPTGTHIQRFEHAPLSGADLGYFSFFLNKKEKVSPPTVESHAPPDPPDPQRPYRVERCAKQVFRAHLYRSGRKTRMALKMAFFIAALSCKISGIPFFVSGPKASIHSSLKDKGIHGLGRCRLCLLRKLRRPASAFAENVLFLRSDGKRA